MPDKCNLVIENCQKKTAESQIDHKIVTNSKTRLQSVTNCLFSKRYMPFCDRMNTHIDPNKVENIEIFQILILLLNDCETFCALDGPKSSKNPSSYAKRLSKGKKCRTIPQND